MRLPDWVQENIAKTEEDGLEGVILENLSSFDFNSIKLTNDRVNIEGLLLDDLK